MTIGTRLRTAFTAVFGRERRDLPRAAPAPSAAAHASVEAPAAAVPPRPSLRVLLAEDNRVNQEVLKAMLAHLGAEVAIADDGAQAVEAAARESFDFALMDCEMPVLDGYEATARIRAAEGSGRRMPIIAITANDFAEDRQRCLAAGMDDYLRKPATMDMLRAVVARWAAERRDERDTGLAPAAGPAREHGLDPAFDALLGRLGPVTMERVVRLYLDDAPQRIRTLREAGDKRDLHELALSAHAFRASSRVLGGVAVSDLGREIERLAKAGDARAFDLLPQIVAATDAFCAALAGYLGEPPPERPFL